MALIERFNKAGLDFTVAEPNDISTDTPTLICLHGIGGDDQSFLPQSEFLSNHYRVVAWNMPGYRGSTALEDVSFAHLANSLFNLIDVLQLSRVHLTGQSIGGMIAQEFAYRFPQQVLSLVLIATTSSFGGKDDSFKNAFLKARLAPLEEGASMQNLAEQSIGHIVGSQCADTVKESAIQSMANVSEASYRDILKCLVTFNRRIEFTQLECPVCLISGSDDTNAPASTMKKMSEKLPGSRYYNIKGAGHLVNLEKDTEVNQIIYQFLSQTVAHE